jgi:hypothetical protein
VRSRRIPIDRETRLVVARDAATDSYRRPAALVALVVLLCSFAVFLGRPVGAATGRKAEVIPPNDLTDQVVEVRWQGFDPTRSDGTFGVVILECVAKPKSVLADCNAALTFPLSVSGNQQSGVTRSDGTGRTFIDIMTTARLPKLACSETKSCSLLVYEQTPAGFDPNGLPTARALVPLNFRKSSADCPPVKKFDARIETEASSAPALYQWAADLCGGDHALTLNVTSTSSDQARSDFFDRNVDVAVSSLPPQPGDAGPKAPNFTVAPIDLTAVVVAYNLIDPVTNQPITDLTLTPRLVARLISDSDVLTFFDDPEFKKLNPNHTFPLQGTDPGLRAEQNADTWIVTNWLNSDRSARAFLDGKDPYGIGVSPEWRGIHYPTKVFDARSQNGVYFPRLGEAGVAERLFAHTKPADTVPASPIQNGFFAVLDLPAARQFALPIAKLTTGVGKPVVTLSASSLAAGYGAMTTTKAGFHVVAGAPTDLAAWPLTKVDHTMFPTSFVNTTVGVQLQQLLRYTVGKGQQTVPNGYAPLPAALVAQTMSVAAALTPPPPPSTTSTTVGSTRPTTVAPAFVAPAGTAFNASLGGVRGGGSTVQTNLPSSPAVAGPERSGSTTPTSTPSPGAKFAALRLPTSGDHLALPVVLAVAFLALFACAADGLGRRGNRWLASARVRRKASRDLLIEQPGP